MAERVIKLPDIGEGVAEVEIAELPVSVGEMVREGDVLASVLTDKATVEIPSPTDGRVVWIGFKVGDKAAVGSRLMTLEVAEAAGEAKSDRGKAAPAAAETAIAASAEAQAQQLLAATLAKSPPPVAPSARGEATAAQMTAPPPTPPMVRTTAPSGSARPERPLASPAVRARARDAGVDLRFVKGSGPAGRILHEDIEAYIAGRGETRPAPGLVPNTSIEEIKVVGLRRKIAQRMQDTKRRVPHFSYIEEVDVTDLEALRTDVNANRKPGQPKLTVLPFLMRALVVALRDYPQLNTRYDDDTDVLHRYGGVHIGIAIQTPNGLMVATVRHAEARTIWDCASEVQRLSEAARSGTISREELAGSTITITSLGPLGGLASTPVINAPEVAIIGVNKIAIRPVWRGTSFEPRKVMNLSSSFDHRIIDGWDAAQFIQRLRSLLESPAKIFMET
jgi:2-oxoisovalerate dehydrogenase E2 component (dihydrolipoyl transacylase)